MFDIAIISPVYDLELSDEMSHLYMVLSWLCKEDPQYKSHFSNIKRNYNDAYVILDNGMNENKMSSDSEIISTAYEINADEIICPDAYLNADETIKRTKTFLDTHYDKYIKDKFNVMAVLQGFDNDSFLKCYNEFLKDERISFLGVGYRNLMKPFKNEIENWKPSGINTEMLKQELTNDCYCYTMSRLYFLKNILNFDALKENDKSIHLLGIYNPVELSFYKTIFNDKELLYIRGCDSASPCQAAQANIPFDKQFGVKDKPKALLDFDRRMDGNVNRLAKYNINIMKDWVK